MTPLVLGLLALLLAGPVPALLSRAARLRCTPAATLLLWQAVALAAVLAALGAGLAVVTDRVWRSDPGPASYVVAGAALLLTALVAGRLLLVGHRVGTELRALRRRHRDQVDLVGSRVDGGGVRVLEHPVPVAYCLPGMRRSRIVLSSGALGHLGQGELAAVLAHERAHLRARHDLVLEAFTVLQRAFPRGVRSRTARAEVGLLVEALADRAAARDGRAGDLRRALLAMTEGRLPGGALGAADLGLGIRVALLGDGRPHRVQALLVMLAALLVLVAPTVLVVVPWVASLR